jgi:hypothetical protein
LARLEAGRNFDEHLAFVLATLKRRAEELGVSGGYERGASCSFKLDRTSQFRELLARSSRHESHHRISVHIQRESRRSKDLQMI